MAGERARAGECWRKVASGVPSAFRRLVPGDPRNALIRKVAAVHSRLLMRGVVVSR